MIKLINGKDEPRTSPDYIAIKQLRAEIKNLLNKIKNECYKEKDFNIKKIRDLQDKLYSKITLLGLKHSPLLKQNNIAKAIAKGIE